MSKQSLLAEVTAANDALHRVLERLDESTMSVAAFADWNMKQLLAHVAGWQCLNAEMMQRMARGERPIPEGADYNDDDRMNVGFADAVSKDSHTVVIAHYITAYNEFVQAAEALPDERFAEDRFAAKMVQGNGIDHVREHLAEIRAYLASPA